MLYPYGVIRSHGLNMTEVIMMSELHICDIDTVDVRKLTEVIIIIVAIDHVWEFVLSQPVYFAKK